MSTLRLGMATLVVPDYDAAIGFFVEMLGFRLIEDRELAPGKRWVVVDPGAGARLLLACAADADQAEAIGRQAGGRVAFFLETDDFAETHAAFLARGVRFEEQPRSEPYGMVAVFSDGFGNRWDLLQRAPAVAA